MPLIARNRYLVLRRLVQASVLFLFIAGNQWGWKALRGNLSTSRLLDAAPLADPYAVLQIAAAGTIVAGEALLGAVIVFLFFAVVAGRAFCGWVCPLNIVTDAANRLRKRLQFGPGRGALSRNTRYWVFGMGLALSSLFGIAAFEWISPISMLHRGIVFGMGMGWTAVAAVFLFDLFVQGNGFCGHLCPLGAFYALTTGFSLVRVAHRKEKCTLCMKCIEACPEPQVLPMVGNRTALVKSGECTNCGRCIEVCDDRAMEFTVRRLRRTTAEQEGG